MRWTGAPPRVAVVHEWLVTYAGSERVLEQILAMLPDADLFAVCDFVPPDDREFLGGRTPRTTFIQKLPFARTRFRAYLPLMPLAIEQLDLTGYDLVISSNHAVAKGVIASPNALHVCYCHTPLRYAWDMQHEYLREGGPMSRTRTLLTAWLLHRLRLWDVRASVGVDRFVANSTFIARRIRRAYRRRATVIHPPVDVERFTPADGARGDYYVTASRFVPYKRVPLIVDAFRGIPDRRLVVIGDGPQRDEVRALAGPNVTLVGHASHDELLRWVRGARAFVFAAAEDFGIAPIEAQAAGTPVIAYGGGALPETIPGLDAVAPCGVVYDEQSPAAIRRAVAEFEAAADRITPEACRANALRFSSERFRARFSRFLDRALDAHRRALAGEPRSRPASLVRR